MQPSDLKVLLTRVGQSALKVATELAPREVDYLAHFQSLTKRYPADIARAALEVAILRQEAQTKFPFADRLYLSRTALEQASSWEVSTYRAERYRPFRRVFDLGCSIGGDTLALAQVTAVVGLERDALRLSMARANAQAVGLLGKTAFIGADLNQPLPLAKSQQASALFFDPARRIGGRRVFSVEGYQPPLSSINAWLPDFPALGVKISPGVDRDELRNFQAEVEFISLRGELKEAVLWFGPLKTVKWRATLLPGAKTLVPEPQAACPLDEPRAYFYEPDPAVLRAGLVQTLGTHLGLAQLDREIAYLTGDAEQPTPFARVWAVEDWLPFSLKRLRAYLRARDVGRVTVKKRGSPLKPEALIHDLKLKGEAERTIFLTQLNGRPIVVVCFP